MPEAEWSATRDLLSTAGSPTERQLVLEAVNARGTSFGVGASSADRSRALAEVSTFADTIRGTPPDELLRRTSGIPSVGRPDDEALGQVSGRGCAPAVTQMLRAENDPIAAWDLTSADPAVRTRLAEEQRVMGDSLNGREFERVLGDGYRLSTLSDEPGARAEFDGAPVPVRTRRDAVDRIANALEAGSDVPIVAHPSGGSSHHALLVTDVREGRAGREFLVADPQARTSLWVNEGAFLAGDARAPGRDPRIGTVSMVYEPAR